MHPRLPTSISALAFSHDGTRIAIAASNTQDASGHDQRKELASRDIDPNHVSITVKSVGSEYKVCVNEIMCLASRIDRFYPSLRLRYYLLIPPRAGHSAEGPSLRRGIR